MKRSISVPPAVSMLNRAQFKAMATRWSDQSLADMDDRIERFAAIAAREHDDVFADEADIRRALIAAEQKRRDRQRGTARKAVA